MRVALCSKYYFLKGGAERYMFNIERLLRCAGHEVAPFAVAFEGSEASPYSSYFVPPPAQAGGTHYRSLRLTRTERVRMASRAFYSFPARQRLEALVEEFRPDVGYLLNIVNYLSPSVIDGLRTKGVPVVMRMSDYNFRCACHSFFRDGGICFDCKTSRWSAVRHRCVHGSAAASFLRIASMALHDRMGAYNRVDHFIAPSRRMAAELVEYGIDSSRVSYVPTPVDTAGIEPDYRPGPYFLFVGRISPEKGVGELLDAFSQVARPGCSLRLVGDLDRDYADTLGSRLAGERVDVRGPAFGEALAEQYRGAHAVVVPSLSHDNSPNVVLEAMAYGKPVIAFAVGGIPDQLAEGSGVLVEPEDVRGLAAAMTVLLEDEDERVRIAQRGRRRAEVEHDPQLHLERLTSIFASVVRTTAA